MVVVLVVVLVVVQDSVDSPINSQIGPFSTIYNFYMMYTACFTTRLGGRNAWGF